MPKHRERAAQKGAKSTVVRTKNKIGGRKSGKGTNKMSEKELTEIMGEVRKRDKNKLREALERRGLI